MLQLFFNPNIFFYYIYFQFVNYSRTTILFQVYWTRFRFFLTQPLFVFFYKMQVPSSFRVTIATVSSISPTTCWTSGYIDHYCVPTCYTDYRRTQATFCNGEWFSIIHFRDVSIATVILKHPSMCHIFRLQTFFLLTVYINSFMPTIHIPFITYTLVPPIPSLISRAVEHEAVFQFKSTNTSTTVSLISKPLLQSCDAWGCVSISNTVQQGATNTKPFQHTCGTWGCVPIGGTDKKQTVSLIPSHYC